MDELTRALIGGLILLVSLIGSGAALLTWSQRKYATMNAQQSESWLNTQKSLSDHLNAQIAERVKAEDGRLDEKEARIGIELALAQVKSEHATTLVKMASLEAEVARVTRINGEMNLTVKEIASNLAAADDQRKKTAVENIQLKNTIARLERRIGELEKMEAEFNKLKDAFANEQTLTAELRRENTTLKERLDAFENQKALEERPVSKPPIIDIKPGETVDGIAVTIKPSETPPPAA